MSIVHKKYAKYGQKSSQGLSRGFGRADAAIIMILFAFAMGLALSTDNALNNGKALAELREWHDVKRAEWSRYIDNLDSEKIAEIIDTHIHTEQEKVFITATAAGLILILGSALGLSVYRRLSRKNTPSPGTETNYLRHGIYRGGKSRIRDRLVN